MRDRANIDSTKSKFHYVEIRDFPAHLNAHIREWAHREYYSKEVGARDPKSTTDSRLTPPCLLFARDKDIPVHEVERMCSTPTEDIPTWALALTNYAVHIVDIQCNACDNIQKGTVVLIDAGEAVNGKA